MIGVDGEAGWVGEQDTLAVVGLLVRVSRRSCEIRMTTEGLFRDQKRRVDEFVPHGALIASHEPAVSHESAALHEPVRNWRYVAQECSASEKTSGYEVI